MPATTSVHVSLEIGRSVVRSSIAACTCLRFLRRPAQENSDDQIALFVRDERTGRRVFNLQALKALGIDPAEARDRGYPLKGLDESDLAACTSRPLCCRWPLSRERRLRFAPAWLFVFRKRAWRLKIYRLPADADHQHLTRTRSPRRTAGAWRSVYLPPCSALEPLPAL